MKLILILIISLPLIGFSQTDLVWVDSIDDDFSFTEEWDYPEGVYINQWGQLSCDGFCPMEIDRMKDDQGRVYDDSLEAFYSIIDTTHIYRSHFAKVRAYEYLEVHQASCSIEKSRIVIRTNMNAGNHCSLHLEIPNDPESNSHHRAFIILKSIRSSFGPDKFNAINGKIEISKEAYENGIIQLRFGLIFENGSNEDDGELSWKGLIQVKIPD